MNGILLIDKPMGWTSSDVVAKLRGVLHEKRIGHSGTLDPMATGLLVLFVGRATRAVEFAESHDKRYLARLRLGLATDTQDTTGTPVGGTPRPVSREELEAALSRFRGEIEQIPPMYSAIKVKGRKLYEIARRGGEVERRPRRVCIRSLSLVGEEEGGDFLFDITCSKGTYVRRLYERAAAAAGGRFPPGGRAYARVRHRGGGAGPRGGAAAAGGQPFCGLSEAHGRRRRRTEDPLRRKPARENAAGGVPPVRRERGIPRARARAGRGNDDAQEFF